MPTPVVSYNILERNAGGGIIITASHNSGLWNGFKYKPHYAGSASPEVVANLESHSDALLDAGGVGVPSPNAAGGVEMVEMGSPYLANLAKAVDLDTIKPPGCAWEWTRCTARARATSPPSSTAGLPP